VKKLSLRAQHLPCPRRHSIVAGAGATARSQRCDAQKRQPPRRRGVCGAVAVGRESGCLSYKFFPTN
jgi:hypothetical protein